MFDCQFTRVRGYRPGKFSLKFMLFFTQLAGIVALFSTNRGYLASVIYMFLHTDFVILKWLTRTAIFYSVNGRIGHRHNQSH